MQEGAPPTHPGLTTPPPLPMRTERPLLIAVSAPSGTGKTTLCNRLVAERSEMDYSISCTTRAPRGDVVVVEALTRRAARALRRDTAQWWVPAGGDQGWRLTNHVEEEDGVEKGHADEVDEQRDHVQSKNG